MCDQISDSILDAYLAIDPHARVAIETLVTSGKVVIAGEFRASQSIDHSEIEAIARNTIKEIGYESDGFHWKHVDIEIIISQQSAEIAMGVDESDGKEEGAGDQGIMFGYACNETPVLMPAAIYYSHKILRTIFDDIHSGALKGFGPDAKSQVTLVYRNGKPVAAKTIVVSIQHLEEYTQDFVRETVESYVKKVMPSEWMSDNVELYVNPTGRFVVGGPESDCGLTGRKIIVDSYGGAAPHGGGAFSGKDPTKVDRSAAYVARYLAKNVVGSKIADECTIQIAYAIGVAKPLALYVDTAGTSKVEDQEIAAALQELVDLTPKGIRTHLKLNAPIYKRTASYGHFGRNPDDEGGFSWEKVDLADALRDKLLVKEAS
ncbi:MAG: methionine adenosyltransferase [Rickettsiales bacterium]|nr:methionine adenosyltransferase [Rickettsiales bacterium]